MLCFALLCFALLWFALLCFALLWLALPSQLLILKVCIKIRVGWVSGLPELEEQEFLFFTNTKRPCAASCTVQLKCSARGFKSASKVLQISFKSASNVLQKCFKVLQKCFKVFQCTSKWVQVKQQCSAAPLEWVQYNCPAVITCNQPNPLWPDRIAITIITAIVVNTNSTVGKEAFLEPRERSRAPS